VSIGVVDLYCASARWLDPHQISLASSMANRAGASAAHHAVKSAEAPVGAEHEMAPALRREVHQATGMVQAQLDISATDAFARLRAYSYTTNQPLDRVAHDVVSRQLDFNILSD